MRQNINTAIITTILLLGSVMVGNAASQKTEQGPSLPYCVVGTGQAKCYDNSREIAPPKPGQPFYGQDAQYNGNQPAYKNNKDGTVTDLNTGLMWTQDPGRKKTFEQTVAGASMCKVGGYTDWRLPSIKELYSLFNASGIDPSGPSDMDTSGLTPFIDTKFFKFAYGDTSAGDRVIDSQFATCTLYSGTTMGGNKTMFGVNFADGRIKGYPIGQVGPRGEKTYYTLYVRGNPSYGKNDFHDNGNGTITDLATGLMWSRADSGRGMNWQNALAWVQKKNVERFLGYSDWRLPNVKELQSIVDYTRCPDTTNSAAINPLFECTQITNEGGKADYPFYWTSTTHAGFRGGLAAMYVAFGRASGWMSSHAFAGGPSERRSGVPRRPGGVGRGSGPPPTGEPSADAGDYQFTDVHGAGAQAQRPENRQPCRVPARPRTAG